MIELTEKSIFDMIVTRTEPKDLHEQIYKQVRGGLSSLFKVSHHTLIYRNRATIIEFFDRFHKLCDELQVQACVNCCGGPVFDNGNCDVGSLEWLDKSIEYLKERGLI